MTQAELWEKAINGKELIHKPTKDIYKLAPNGTIRLGGDIDNCSTNLVIPDDWKILEAPEYYYQWEKQETEGLITITQFFMTDSKANLKGFIRDGWRRMESSKRTWET